MNSISLPPSARAAALLPILLAACCAAAPAPIILTGADMRPATSLDGQWASIVEPLLQRPLQLSP